MRSLPRIPWNELGASRPTGARHTLFAEAERLVELYRFRDGVPSCDVRIVHPGTREVEITDPGRIDWSDFPTSEAVRSAAAREMNRLLRRRAGREI